MLSLRNSELKVEDIDLQDLKKHIQTRSHPTYETFTGKYQKTFETDILKLRADELNFTLCMFVKV